MIDIKYYRKMRDIQRLTGVPTLRNYDLMQHQYMVGMLFRHFASLENVPYDIHVWDLVLNHDVVETITQDLVYTVKNFNKETQDAWAKIEQELTNENFSFKKYSDEELIKGMNEAQYTLFKICDILELFIFVREEMSMGNKNKEIREVEYNCLKMLKESTENFPKIKKFIKEQMYE